MRRLPLPFLRLRLLTLFLISLAAVEGSLLAWSPARLSDPFVLAGFPLALAAAAVIGTLLQDPLAAAAERSGRGRLAFVIGGTYAVLVLLILLGLLSGSRDAVEPGGQLFRLLQPVALLAAGLGRGHLGVLVNALVLTSYSILAGGAGAALAVTALGGLLPAFLVVDFAARRLSEYPVDAFPPPWPVLREGMAWAGLAFLALLAWVVRFPLQPHVPLVRSGALPKVDPSQVSDLLLQLGGAFALGLLGFWAASRLGLGRGGAAGVEDVERVEARSLAEPVEEGPALAPSEAEPGRRGRIIRVYLDLQAQLARWGWRRPPGCTPRAFAGRIEPREPADRLAELFARARWASPGDLPEGDVEAACRAGEAILDHHRRRNRGAGPVV
jgi:hypothetical protein